MRDLGFGQSQRDFRIARTTRFLVGLRRGLQLGTVEIVKEVGVQRRNSAVEMNTPRFQGHSALAITHGVVDLMQGDHHGGAVFTVDVGENLHDLAR
jgi:hypothetical protein